MCAKRLKKSEMLQALSTIQWNVEEDAVVAASERLYVCLAPDLRAFIYGRIHANDAADVFQEAMKGIFGGICKFQGGSEKSLLAWCYRIARNKINDHLRKHISRRLEPIPDEEIEKYVEESGKTQPLSEKDKLDCEYAMKLLKKADPECHEYLWNRYMADMEYWDMGTMYEVNSDAMRMRITRCLETARTLLSK